MNIHIPDSWLREYVETNAKPEDVIRILSLHAFSVEKTIQWEDGDTIYEIEITPNRGDALSVLGIARELMAILPRTGFTAKWVKQPLTGDHSYAGADTLDVVINDKNLVPRFSAVVLDNILLKESTDIIKSRLEKVGIRPLDNVVDITNYLMIELGQPMHAFDYHKIKGHKMVLRESQEGEELTTLDGLNRKLPGGVIVIEDGEGRLIDLCGIMGCENSAVDSNTQKVLLFVQIYDPVRIRKASMNLGHRTDAALRFEKGVDVQGVVPALNQAVEMLYSDGITVSSKLIDIVNVASDAVEVLINYDKINLISGNPIPKKDVDKILTDLGFQISGNLAKVPSWRIGDIEIPEDIAEEAIRLHGYEKVPNWLPTGEIPTNTENKTFFWEDEIKNLLKNLGFFESYTYSMTTQELAGEGALALANPLSEEFAYMRTSLLPQLWDVLNKNKGYSHNIKLFEMSAVYMPKSGDLPDQPLKLGLATSGVEYLELKGVVEAIYSEMGIKQDLDIEIWDSNDGKLGIELDFDSMVTKSVLNKQYTPISKFNSIKEDFTLNVPEGVTFNQIRELITGSDQRIVKVSYKDLYKQKLTLSIEFLDREKQLSSEDTQVIRTTMLEKLSTIDVSI